MVRPRRSLQGNTTTDKTKSNSTSNQQNASAVAAEPSNENDELPVSKSKSATSAVGTTTASAANNNAKKGTKDVKRKRNSEIVDENTADDANQGEESDRIGAAVNHVGEANEPRKRRLASLNAEFLVHYCSTTASHVQQPTNATINTIEASSSTPLVVKEATEENQTDSKRRRTVSQDSAGRSKKVAAVSEESKPLQKPPDKEPEKPTTNARGKRKQQASVASKTKNSKAAESDAGSIDRSISKATEENQVDDEEVGAANTKRTRSARQTNRNADMSYEENGEETSDMNDDSASNAKEKETKKTRGRQSRASKAKREPLEATEVKVEPVASGRPKREASMRASAMIIQTNEIEKTRFQYYTSATTTPTTMFAAATTTATATNGKQTSRSTSNKKVSPANDHTRTSAATAKTDLNNSKVSTSGEFQVPAPPAHNNSKNGNKNSSANHTPELTGIHHVTKHTKRQNSTNSDLSASGKVKFQLGGSSPANQSSANLSTAIGSLGIQSPSVLTSIPSSLRQISTTTTLASSVLPTSTGVNCNGADLNDPEDEDNDSSDVLIVMERAGTASATKNGSRSKQSSNERPLTEEVLAEHNKIHGTISSSGGGTFSNYTREYITKWALDYKPSNDKPFSPGVIPIESFGIKVIQEPQYVAGKPTKQTYHLITTKPDKTLSPSIEASVVPTTNAASFPSKPIQPSSSNGVSSKQTNGGHQSSSVVNSKTGSSAVATTPVAGKSASTNEISATAANNSTTFTSQSGKCPLAQQHQQQALQNGIKNTNRKTSSTSHNINNNTSNSQNINNNPSTLNNPVHSSAAFRGASNTSNESSQLAKHSTTNGPTDIKYFSSPCKILST